jgi:hypothetical protein
LIHECTGNGHALLLSARELGRKVVDASTEADHLEHAAGAPGTFLLADLCIEHRQFDVLQSTCS